MKLDVRSDLRRVAGRVGSYPSKIVRPAASRALTRAATTGRKEASKQIRAVYAMPAAAAKDRITIRGATPARLEAVIRASGDRIPLYAYSARQTRAGVTVRVLRAEGRKIVKGRREFMGKPFIATMKSGHTGVFQRKTAARLQIAELFSVDVPTAMISEKVVAVIDDVILDRFRTEFERELRFRANRGK